MYSLFISLTEYSLPSKYKCTFVSGCTSTSENMTSSPYTRENPFPARLLSNERLTPPSHFQDVRLVTFDLRDSEIRYCMLHYILPVVVFLLAKFCYIFNVFDSLRNWLLSSRFVIALSCHMEFLKAKNCRLCGEHNYWQVYILDSMTHSQLTGTL